jgi:hypothetical protein
MSSKPYTDPYISHQSTIIKWNWRETTQLFICIIGNWYNYIINCCFYIVLNKSFY